MGRAVVVPRSANTIHRIFRPGAKPSGLGTVFALLLLLLLFFKICTKKLPSLPYACEQGLFLFLFYRCVTPENQDEETLPEEPRRALPAAKLKRATGYLTRHCFQQHLRNRVFLRMIPGAVAEEEEAGGPSTLWTESSTQRKT